MGVRVMEMVKLSQGNNMEGLRRLEGYFVACGLDR